MAKKKETYTTRGKLFNLHKLFPTISSFTFGTSDYHCVCVLFYQEAHLHIITMRICYAFLRSTTRLVKLE